MTTLERNSLFMQETTTRVLGDCWITSIKKLSLTFLVESAWYEYKLVHVAICRLFLFPHSSEQRILEEQNDSGVVWRRGGCNDF